MILVDTSVWIEHFRHGRADLVQLLEDERVTLHPFVIGELACGNLARRDEVLDLLQQLPSADVADHDEAMHVLNARGLSGRGIGWVDVHLLASAAISDVKLWTLDRSLHAAARKLGVAAAER